VINCAAFLRNKNDDDDYTVKEFVNSRQKLQSFTGQSNKKLSHCWETVRRESMPRIAEMDVEMTI